LRFPSSGCFGAPARSLSVSLLLVALLAEPSAAHWSSKRPDGHAPIGVMGDHLHAGGEWMVSYRYMYMEMEGMRDGTSTVSDAEVLDPNGYDFSVTPTKMPMHMHMLGMMYAPIDGITLMAMVNFLSLSMDHVNRMGGAFTTSSDGAGDFSLTALVMLNRWERQQMHLNLGMSFPTGSITKSDVTPMSAPAEAQLPYPMQLGSGTFDPIIGVTYLGQATQWSWGAQVKGIFRLGTNDNDYTLGDRGMLTAWGARVLGHRFSVSGRVEGSATGNIDGADPAYDMSVANRVVPTVFPDLQGGNRIDAGVGVNFLVPGDALKGLRLAVEGMMPLYQNLDGPQLELPWKIVAGAQYAF